MNKSPFSHCPLRAAAVFFAFAVAAAFGPLVGDASGCRNYPHLIGTSPVAGSVVPPPENVNLFFQSPVVLGASDITIVHESGTPVLGSTNYYTGPYGTDLMRLVFTPLADGLAADGRYDVTFRAVGFDTCPPNIDSFSFTVSRSSGLTERPTVTITSPITRANQAQVVISGTTEPGATIEFLIVERAYSVSQPRNYSFPAVVAEDGRFSATVDLTTLIRDGLLTVKARASKGENTTIWGDERLAVKDTASPRLLATAPADQASVRPSKQITATYDERLDPATSTMSVQDSTGAQLTGTVGYSSGNRSMVFRSATPLGQGGPYSVSVHAVDIVGESTSSTFTFTIDPNAPETLPGDITTVAGGPGLGAPTTIWREASGLTVRNGVLYSADRSWGTVRALDLSTGVEEVIAGTGVKGEMIAYDGTGTPATETSLHWPEGLAVDNDGNIYINHERFIRKVAAAPAADGTRHIATVAGHPRWYGFSGDGGPAAEALFWGTTAMTFDTAGNLYIADGSACRVRKIDAETGIITTVAGGAFVGDPSTGIGTYCGYTGDGIPATEAQLERPASLAFDAAGNLYIGEASRVRKVDVATGLISTVAGDGTYRLYPAAGDGGPANAASIWGAAGLAFDAAGNLYISDAGNHLTIRRVDAQTTIITTVAGTGGQYGYTGDGGPATSAKLASIDDLAIDSEDNLYVSAMGIRKVDARTGIITTIAGGPSDLSSGPRAATSAQLSSAHELAVDTDGNFYISERWSGKVRKVNSSGELTTVAGTEVLIPERGLYEQWRAPRDGNPPSGEGGPATNAMLGQPTDIAVHPDGHLYLADADGRYVRKVDADSGIITTVMGSGTRGAGGDGGPATAAQLNAWGLAFDAAGNLFIAQYWEFRVRKVDARTGIITTVAGDGTNGTLRSSTGDGGPATSAALEAPVDIAVDSRGDLYIAENSRIRKVDSSTGVISTVAGGGPGGSDVWNKTGVGGPATSALFNHGGNWIADVDVDVAGNLYIAGASQIYKVDAQTGILTAIAGYPCYSNGLVPTPGVSWWAGPWMIDSSFYGRGFSGDGGPALSAMLFQPHGLAVDSHGSIYITERENRRVRKITGAGTSDGVTLPTVKITSPANDARFAEGSTIVVAADATVTGGQIAKVAFFQDGVLVGEDTSAPYAVALANAKAGAYRFRAVATDTTGRTASATVRVTVSSVEACSGIEILSDPTGDSDDGLPSHDVQSVSVSQPYGVGAGKLVFTIKMADLSTLPPNTTWPVRFRGPDGRAEYKVQMRTTAGPDPVFEYGRVGLPETLTGADPLSGYKADGTITIVVPASGVGVTVVGQTLSYFVTRITVGASGTGLTPDNAPDDTVGIGQYIFIANDICQTVVQPSGVVSRKLHGGSNAFNINLPVVGNPGIECRTGGANGNHKLVFTFANPVSVNGTPAKARVTSGTGTVSNVTVNGAEVTVDLTGVANAQTITLTLFSVSDGTNTGDVSVSMGILLGDTTADGSVNSADIGQTKSQSGQAVTASNFREDLTVDGSINSADISLVKSKSGTALP